MVEPRISVVIPTHGGRFLPAAVASVRAQTIGGWELVIVDDGSTDGTAAAAAQMAADDPRVRVVTNPMRTGIAAARNRGLAAISPCSEYVAFLDHDDVWMPDTLEVLRAELVARPTASAAHGTAVRIDHLGKMIAVLPASAWTRMGVTGDGSLMEWPRERPTQFANLAYEDCITSTGSGLIRRTDLLALGGFDLRAEPADDYDLWIRLARRGEIGFVDRAVLSYRSHPEQASSWPPPPRGRGTPYVRYKMITSPDNTPEQRRLAVAGFRKRQERLFRERVSDIREDWARRAHRDALRHALDLGARAAAFLRGRPWAWHR